jgi:hypothetical protein
MQDFGVRSSETETVAANECMLKVHALLRLPSHATSNDARRRRLIGPCQCMLYNHTPMTPIQSHQYDEPPLAPHGAA